MPLKNWLESNNGIGAGTYAVQFSKTNKSSVDTKVSGKLLTNERLIFRVPAENVKFKSKIHYPAEDNQDNKAKMDSLGL